MAHVSASAPAVQAGSHFDVIVFRAAPHSKDFARSRSERLTWAPNEAAAWEILFAELRRDGALIGGDVQEVH